MVVFPPRAGGFTSGLAEARSMSKPVGIFRRAIEARISDALEDTPAVFLRGARQVGKSTLALQFAHGARFLTLDDALTRAAATYDPDAFVRDNATKGRVIIDEVQRVPELLIAIKAEIDRDRRPGRFILTGSANITMLPHIAESLAGRVEILTVYPLNRAEIERRETSLDAMLSGEPVELDVPTGRDALLKTAATGGFPEAINRRTDMRRRRWFESYLETAISREVQAISQIGDQQALFRILRMLATRSGQPRNIESMAHDSGVPASTIRRYLDLLETIFIVSSIPAWFINADKRITKQPKNLLIDSGLYTSLLIADALPGPLLEMFVGCELQRRIAASDEIMRLYHYRTHRGAEVDWVVERANGRVVGCEVKAATTVEGSDFRGLRDLQEAAGDRFSLGIVWYAGHRVVRFGADLLAVPIACL